MKMEEPISNVSKDMRLVQAFYCVVILHVEDA